MTKCVRFCGAYTYRLTRRHSMILLIISFLLIILVILHLYARRHQNLRHGATVIGDFEYRPANFLKGQHPNETISYCRFNYGLPDEIRWSEITIHPTPEMGAESPYRVIYDVITGTAYAERAKHDAVTYVTQATPEFLYHVVEIARFWDGPISLSVFVPNYDLDTTMQIFKHLCHCYVGMSKVSLHIFYPKHLLPVIIKRESIATTSSPPTTVASNITREQILQQKLDNYRRLTNKTRAEYIKRARQKKAELMMVKLQDHRSYYQNVKFLDCSGPVSFDVPTYRKENNLVYPINVGRNVARNASRTNYFIVSDIEMVPSDGLAEKFLRMVRRLMGEKKRREGCVFAKTVFVVPLFEVESGEEIPRHKDTLVQLVAANRATYFHQRSCSHCQRFPKLQSWLAKPPTKDLEPMIISKREYPYHRWEPLYFGTQKEPWYSEMLSWEGRQDKMTQMLELCLQEYRLVVLDGGFLCHAAARPPSKHVSAERANSRRYASILNRLKRKYNNRPQCIVH